MSASEKRPMTTDEAKEYDALLEKKREVKEKMVDHIHKILERGENIQPIEDKTETLKAEALQYRKRADALRRRMRYKCFCCFW
jgi:polyhydroxyalkanoate synthesis regulator phasin